jgi:hypothetical protein
MALDTFPPHLHFELYLIAYHADGTKFYVLLDPYGAYTATGKQKYGTYWSDTESPAKTFNEIDYRP